MKYLAIYLMKLFAVLNLVHRKEVYMKKMEPEVRGLTIIIRRTDI